jgi:hypothetical protein
LDTYELAEELACPWAPSFAKAQYLMSPTFLIALLMMM